MYSTNYIIRFDGTLTQGPNAGRSYTFANSWAGVGFATIEEAKAKLALYREREPAIQMKLFSRKWVGDRNGKFVETEV